MAKKMTKAERQEYMQKHYETNPDFREGYKYGARARRKRNWKKVPKVFAGVFLFLVSMLKEIFTAIGYFLESNLYAFGIILEVLTPFVTLFIGEYVYEFRGYYAIGGEIGVPVAMIAIAYLLKKTANRLGKGYTIPLPPRHERFTQDMGDGEIQVDQNQLQEIILYLADVEDYLEKTGRL